MQLIDQHTKKIMEGCKERALDAGLKFDKESLEYIVTNMDMLELSPKNMIPTLYDYWLQDIQVLHGKGEYEVFPHNPYETVINTRPAISFYNDNNPDWLNVMIFYHVIAHIDFFQNNKFFERTWNYDFKEKALTEKRIMAKLRAKHGRKADYTMEFARGIDNLVGYFDDIAINDKTDPFSLSDKADYYFNVFLPEVKKTGQKEFLNTISEFNKFTEVSGGEEKYFKDLINKSPEFEDLFHKHRVQKSKSGKRDLMEFIASESKKLNTPENSWKKTVLGIVRDTSLYFSPQIRTKTMNEGWASYWHEKLFMADDRIKGHEVAFARINAKVTSLSKVGLNPYAIGWRLFMYVEEMVEKGKLSLEFNRLKDSEKRNNYEKITGKGRDFIFFLRENYCDFTFLNSFIDQDFVDKYKLMVVGQRINQKKNVKEYYVKSRRAKDYKNMVLESLYHPPSIKFEVGESGELLLNHVFEGKELYRDYIQNTLIGIEYLWGEKVILNTQEVDWEKMQKRYQELSKTDNVNPEEIEPVFEKVKYTVKDKKVTREKAGT